MNDNYLITLSKFKANTFEFELETDGISLQEANVSFIIESSAMNLMFEANNLDGKKWEVVVPPLPILQKTMYPFRITLATEGFFFEPMVGAVNVVGEGSVRVSTAPTNTIKEAKRISESIDSIDARKMSLAPKKNPRKSSMPKVHPLQENETKKKGLPSEEVVESILRKKESKPVEDFSKKVSLFEQVVKAKQAEAPEINEKDAAVADILKEFKGGKETATPARKGGLLSSLVG